MSELAERFEVLVEAFARKIAALSIDAAEQKGRADRAEAEVERLRREYEPGYPAVGDASSDGPVLDEERKELCDEINKWKRRYYDEREAHTATTAKLGRAVDILEDLARRGGLGWETHERLRAILADADGKVKP